MEDRDCEHGYRAAGGSFDCPLCGEPRDQHVPGPPDPPGPDAACLLRDPVRRVPHRRRGE